MGCECKLCRFETSTQTGLLRHYRLRHGHGGELLPCIHQHCFCSFKTWGSLRSHLSRNHSHKVQESVRSETLSFTCQCCSTSAISSERELFVHLSHHLKKYETVVCVFKNCDFSTNIHGTFASHKSRKHTPHTLQDFKDNVLKMNCASSSNADDHSIREVQDVELSVTDDGDGDDDIKDRPNILEKKIALLFLKLESIFNVSNRCIDEVIEELHFISHSASGPMIKNIIKSCLAKHNCEFDEAVVSDVVTELSNANTLATTLSHSGPLSTAYKRRAFFKEQFGVVEPVEYVLSKEENRTFQYIPLPKSLLQTLAQKEIQNFFFNNEAPNDSDFQYRTFSDGNYYKTNELFSAEHPSIPIILYVNDFEICNPLGTSRKKHKVTAVYWMLAGVPGFLRSSLSSVFLAMFCKADDVKRFGYRTVLAPLLEDLVSLEKEGLYVPALGRKVKGTVFCVVADNLGAHSMGGLLKTSQVLMCADSVWVNIPSSSWKRFEQGHFKPEPKNNMKSMCRLYRRIFF